LKILVAETTESSEELQILHHLANITPRDGAQHIIELLAEFEHHGPNGTHKCLVFEPMGPSVNSMVEELPQFKPRMWGMKIRYPPRMAKNILKQSLQGLAFLHRNDIAHGDFQPGNMLFSLTNINEYEEDVLRQEENVESRSISPPVERLDGKQDKWAPRYLCIAQPLASFASPVDDFRIKLSDMGGGKCYRDTSDLQLTIASILLQ
jgi:non-specific serine/threonine protein kinase